MILSDFVHLRTHSSYSLAEGAIKIEELIKLCHKNRMPAVAITDRNNLFCSLEFSKLCSNSGIKPIIGVTIDIEVDDYNVKYKKFSKYDNILLLAKNKLGYNNLIKLVSNSFLNNIEGNSHINLNDLFEYSEGLIILSGGTEGPINRLIVEGNVKNAEMLIEKLKEVFKDNFYIELSRHNLSIEEKAENYLLEFAYKHNIPLVATNNVFYATRQMYEAHDALLCISEGRYVTEEDRKKSNSEYYFKTEREMKALFKDIPEALINTLIIAQKCSVKSEEHDPMLPDFKVETGRSQVEEFKFRAFQGLDFRLIDQEKLSNFNKIKEKYTARLSYELDTIVNMKFPGYFLIVSDFIKWSKDKNIPVGPGRGSGAGSLVAWCLEITDIDPLKFNLLFERFLNPERVSMPDFDIDFCQERRDEVIAYVREKYGENRVAQIITFGKLQAKAVIRDVGRVLQMPYGQVDKISKMVPFNAVNPVTLSQAIEMEPALRKARDEDEQISKLLSIALKLEGLNRHTSTHAAGIIIAENNLIDTVPVCKDYKTNMLVTQYSMKYAEAAGLVKFDFLGLKTLTTISNTCKLIQNIGNETINISKINLDDKRTYDLLSQGASIGVFQFESPGMQDALRKLRPDNIADLIALGALYRPGPMDNIPTYIACKHGLENPDYLHPKLENALKETFGVIIYQEQVMEIAQILAGYSLGRADLLRRAMGKKIKAEMDAQRQMFVDGAIENGVPKNQASSIFDLVAKFAGYGFNKSHAAAYALISYQTAYLKANYTVEFIVASMNLEINDTDKINVFCGEASNMNISVLPPDINKSQAHFHIEIINGKKFIRYALGAIRNVGLSAMNQVILERNKKLSFKDITDFVSSIDSKILNKRQMENLIKSGAFDSMESNRRKLFDSIEVIIRFCNESSRESKTNQISLFKAMDKGDYNKIILLERENYNKNELLAFECDSIGFYLTDHPLNSIKNYLEKLNIQDSHYLRNFLNKGTTILKLAAVTISTKTRSSPRGRYLQVQLSDPKGIFNLAIYDDNILASARELLDSKKPLLISAEVRKDEGGIKITAQKIQALEDFLENQNIELQIYLENDKSIKNIKEILGGEGILNTKITITIIDKNYEVDIDIKDKFHFSANKFSLIENIDNVKKINIK